MVKKKAVIDSRIPEMHLLRTHDAYDKWSL